MEEKSKFIDGLAVRGGGNRPQRHRPTPMSEMEVGVRRSARTPKSSVARKSAKTSASRSSRSSSRYTHGSSSMRASVRGSQAGHTYSRDFVSSRESRQENGWSNPKKLDAALEEIGYKSVRRPAEKPMENTGGSWIDRIYNDTKREKIARAASVWNGRKKSAREDSVAEEPKKPVRRQMLVSGDPLAMRSAEEQAELRRAQMAYERAQQEQLKRRKAEVARKQTATSAGAAAKKSTAVRVQKKVAPKKTVHYDDEFDTDEISGGKTIRGNKKLSVNELEDRRYAKLYGKNGKKKSWVARHRFAMVVVGIFIVVAVGVYMWGDSIISKITGGNSNMLDVIRAAISSDVPLKRDKYGRTNVLLFGTSGYDMNGTNGDYQHDGAQLTDSIMIVSVDEGQKDVAMINVPRDLYTNTCSNNKANELFWCANPDNNNEQAGSQAIMKRLSEIYGLEFQYYVHVNWVSLISVVNALGDITVTLDESIDDAGWTEIKIDAGVPTYLNGEQALGLARARHGTEGGDFTRANSQQKIILAMKQKVAESGLNLIQIMQIATALGDNLRTNAPIEEIAAASKVLMSMPLNAMHPLSLMDEDAQYMTTGYIDGISYVYPTAGQFNYDDIHNYVRRQLSSNAQVREEANILVLNGSGVDGAAAAEQAELIAAGFNVGGIGNAPAITNGGYYEPLILYKTSRGAAKANNLQKLERYYAKPALAENEIPQGVDSAGYDFVIILGVGYEL